MQRRVIGHLVSFRIITSCRPDAEVAVLISSMILKEEVDQIPAPVAMNEAP